ncbi:family 10 glycosylhydrolase [Mucilaginibacter mali]|uniref:Family 10 glycosylhydrolase n=1 Tax=Mucilaginibacter mali TaxID=2740462 RepID=A0A7D4UGW5_9SPHI|nr:family 10 glycosylhydrolase [Mucilaginibacter mali]QKJ32376.1 family 10 glycosylhydrolase [Mucilaginibacter mali]
MAVCKRLFFTISAIYLGLTSQAQSPVIPPQDMAPKREFRAAWIATVVNIDWPSSPRLSTAQQKKELTDILDFDKQIGLNAAMFQVRPAADAFYFKSKEPWSKWLTGKQGQAPDPVYDPLDLAITEAHKRGMELHAWFNPYRATMDGNFAALAPQHITRIKPEWFFIYDNIKLFNPGIPEVRDYIIEVILNVVDNYDIDGVHMDDYFYPYRVAGQKIGDADAFKKYGGDFTNIDDWRRNNVNLLIKALGDSIHKHKPFMKYGISPMGIWANKSQNPEGSDTHGGDSYYELYADSRKWIKEGWVDYINPQLYWTFKYRLAAFETLLDWWSDNTYGRHLYIGMAAYRINERLSPGFKIPSQMPDQIKYIRANPRVQGSVYFSQKSLINNPLGFADSLKKTYYNHPALPPVMIWLDSIPPNQPQQLLATALPGKVSLKWTAPLPARDKEATYGYVIYRFGADEKVDVGRAENILSIRYNTEQLFEDRTAEKGKKYIYVITAIDRLKNESEHSEPVTVVGK